ncbi:MAG: hypothetical protein ACOX3G_03290 [Armatimonadota bacterium]|jgi:hypothetical protein
MSRFKKELFVFCSRPLFRTCEIVCNHAARILIRKRGLSSDTIQREFEKLNTRRIECQRELNEIGKSHGHICADCAGKCCGGVRERDAFLDRVIQNPSTPHLGARRRSGELATPKPATASAELPPVEGFCTQLTCEGCKIPYELRPIQCTAYFCRRAIDALSSAECDKGIRALVRLMNIQLRCVALALKTWQLK